MHPMQPQLVHMYFSHLADWQKSAVLYTPIQCSNVALLTLSSASVNPLAISKKVYDSLRILYSVYKSTTPRLSGPGGVNYAVAMATFLLVSLRRVQIFPYNPRRQLL